ncbi:MAG: RNA methyltransferase [Lachnospiraceae bacterium]|jgi:tRNA G18 (ribose-2'-O)-methylase SpoU|nr:RNA methyltransferase [Lachnospiraceae bacterium]MCI1398460.1 RNA methyltransferase [Lachnospiraceae bacterium]MCI1423898.1 RNA methyltransferase [Lachnospiraceae bacterium]MCI1452697.1 RNA methyltransferase [Lachnospiraceae bacterium]
MQTVKIRDLSLPETALYNEHRESALMHCNEPEPGIFIAESPKVILRALSAGYEPISVLMEEKQQNLEGRLVLEALEKRKSDIPVYVGDRELLIAITGFALNRGVLCAMRRRKEKSPRELLEETGAERICILEEVENPTNVGAIFRSAAALSMDAVLLSPGCSDPLYRRAARVSMGTVFQVPWTYLPEGSWPEETLRTLHELSFTTVAMALRDHSMAVDDPVLRAKPKLAVILGTEGDGLRDVTIEGADATVCIPMAHGVDSLNVAAAASVAFWELGHRDGKEEEGEHIHG